MLCKHHFSKNGQVFFHIFWVVTLIMQSRHQVVTNNTMRLVIIILILFVFLASMIVSSLLTSVFSFLATNLFKKKNLKYEFQCIFLIFLIVSSLQPAISTLTSPFFQTDIPIAYITALFLFGGLLIHKTHNILRSILLVLLLVVVQLVVIFIAWIKLNNDF